MELSSLQIRIARSENLPVLPQAVSTILKLADDPNASQRELERAFERDPGITAKILKVANSAYYGMSNVSSVGRAISMLGMSTIRSVVLGVGMQAVLTGKSATRSFDRVQYWRHSLATAIVCRILGKLRAPSRAEELYSAGMMHDIGLIVLERFMPQELDQAIEMARRTGSPLWLCEKEIIGFSHADLGGLLAEKWNLSEFTKQAILYHHELPPDPIMGELIALVSASDCVAYESGYHNQTPNPPSDAIAAKAHVGLPPEQWDIVMQVVAAELNKAQESFNLAA